MVRIKFLVDFANFKAGDKVALVRERSIALVRGGVAELLRKADTKWLEKSTPAKTSS